MCEFQAPLCVSNHWLKPTVNFFLKLFQMNLFPVLVTSGVQLVSKEKPKHQLKWLWRVMCRGLLLLTLYFSCHIQPKYFILLKHKKATRGLVCPRNLGQEQKVANYIFKSWEDHKSWDHCKQIWVSYSHFLFWLISTLNDLLNLYVITLSHLQLQN